MKGGEEGEKRVECGESGLREKVGEKCGGYGVIGVKEGGVR